MSVRVLVMPDGPPPEPSRYSAASRIQATGEVGRSSCHTVSTGHLDPKGRGHRHHLTSSGDDLFKVCETLGEWGARWLEIAPENLDRFVALWSMRNALRRDRLPDQRMVIRLHFTGFRPHERYWLLLEFGEAEREALDALCATDDGDSTLARLAAPPRAPSPAAVLAECQQLAIVRAASPDHLDWHGITPNRRRSRPAREPRRSDR